MHNADGHLRRYAHRGVTLIELMFAIGIMLVGLLGVAALIPLAGYEIGRGLTADRMSATGRNAVAEFDIRSMRRHDMHVYYDGSQFNSNQAAFCIDPLGRSTAVNQSFPLVGVGTGVTMPRISLRNRPGGQIMGRVQAERLFVARDDLAVQRLSDPTLPPQQVYGMPVSRRQYYGGFSWFATLVQEINKSDQYVLSVVVLEDRNLQAAEQELPVTHLGGSGGGEVVLTGQLDLRTGNWLMLTAAPNRFRWYRVMNSMMDVDNSNPIEFVTLEGADIDSDFVPVSAVLVPGVVGVFEKTIRLEDTSLWDVFP
jgi:prepilin-type N-terminal cleavage/methylation domain-containing protein